MTRSLMYDAAAIAIHRMGATVSEVHSHFPGVSLLRVRKALQNAGNRRLIKCIRRGSQPALWAPMDMESQDYREGPRRPDPTPPASVWELASPQQRRTTVTGTVHRPMGGWGDN